MASGEQPTSVGAGRLSGQQRTALMSIGAAAVLVALKLGTGLATGSLGLISAGIESSGDVVAAVLTFVAIRVGARPADSDHPYGHRRLENLAALGEAAILTGGGIVVVVEAVGRLAGGGEPFKPAWYVFAVIGVALAIDVSRVVVSVRTSRRYGSAALRSNAFHFAGDMAGSFAVLVGIVLVSAGIEQGDAIAALIVAGIIFFAASRLIAENGSVLMDRTPASAERRATEAIAALEPDIELRRLRVRESGGRYFADAVVTVPPGQAIVEGHQAADRVEEVVRDALPDSDVVVHVEPRRSGLDLRDRVLATTLAEPLVREAHDITIYERDGGGATVTLHMKLPADLSLAEAHAVSDRLEAAIREEPEVEAVETHLEPLEQPLKVTTSRRPPDSPQAEAIDRIVAERTGRPPRVRRIVTTSRGPVVMVTVGVGRDVDLARAHEIASELEEALRSAEPSIAEVVVHTEP
jgi:cation diffusion facilitator family transporter